MMPAMAILDLSSNSLTGGIPVNFGSSPALETLNLAYKNLTGSVPGNGVLRCINPHELAGNDGLCGGVLAPCSGSRDTGTAAGRPRGGSGARLRRIAMGWIAVVAAFAAALAGRYAYRRWFCDDDEGIAGDHGAWPWRLTAFQLLGFTSADVLACVKEANVVGMGATGVVYRAELPRARAVIAVKKLWRPAAKLRRASGAAVPVKDAAAAAAAATAVVVVDTDKAVFRTTPDSNYA
nr:unnamed protein product [Digitaria exilis]